VKPAASHSSRMLQVRLLRRVLAAIKPTYAIEYGLDRWILRLTSRESSLKALSIERQSNPELRNL